MRGFRDIECSLLNSGRTRTLADGQIQAFDGNIGLPSTQLPDCAQCRWRREYQYKCWQGKNEQQQGEDQGDARLDDEKVEEGLI